MVGWKRAAAMQKANRAVDNYEIATATLRFVASV